MTTAPATGACAASPLHPIARPIAFDRITADAVEPAIEAHLADARSRLQAIAAETAPPTYANTLGALDAATAGLGDAMAIVGHLEAVVSTPELRAAYNRVQPRVSELYARIPLDAGLWQRLQAFAATEEAAGLTGAEARFLSLTLADFRRHGAELDMAGKERLAALDVELSALCTRFAQQLLDATQAFGLQLEDSRRLAGLPPAALALARQKAAEHQCTGFRLTLDEPCLHAVLTHADDANLRRTLWRAARQRATSPERDNRPLIARILALRAEKAALLGYANFGALVLEERMAHDPERARAFLAELEAHSRPAFEAECAALEGFMRQHTGLAEATLAPWDVAYFAEKQRKATLGFDEEALKAYFPLEQVLEGLFALCQQLFRIQITAVDLPTYHKSVRSYRISDEGGQALAHFYADFFPRPGKRGGAWMDAFGYASAGLTDRSQHHIGVICANLSPPTDDLPALLTMREVETVFHEFGHLLHHALTDVPVRSLAGTNVAWDFVELPSQIMENWCWEKEGLDRIARHWQSGESLPDALWQRMQQARRYRAASAMMRQIGFATTDLALHLDYQPEVHNGPTDYARSVLARYAPAALPDDDAMIAGFSHLFGGAVAYACGYYSYKWAEVLDADAFSRFKEEGIFSPEVGRDWRTQVLAQGNSQKPEALFASFRGRPPRIDALLQRAGIAPNMVPAAGAC